MALRALYHQAHCYISHHITITPLHVHSSPPGTDLIALWKQLYLRAFAFFALFPLLDMLLRQILALLTLSTCFLLLLNHPDECFPDYLI